MRTHRPEHPIGARPSPANSVRHAVLTLSGALGALVVAEVGLGVFITPIDEVPPDIARDSVGAPVVAVRQIEEGVATAHFSGAGARLTGTAWIDSAATVVVIGDSYIVAREVPDDRTMGAWLERRARQAGVPIDVRQYGWRGASAARYVASAPAVLSRWKPSSVIVPLSSDDLDGRAISGNVPYFQLTADSDAVVVGASPAGERPPPPRFILPALIARRWRAIWVRAPRRLHRWLATKPADAVPEGSSAAPAERYAAKSDTTVIPLAVTRALKRAFGAPLVIAYVADVRVAGGDSADPLETRLLSACKSENVPCVSLRGAMLRARAAGVVTRGFSTTTLGVGHLNADGHRMLADAVWPLVRGLVRARPILAARR